MRLKYLIIFTILLLFSACTDLRIMTGVDAKTDFSSLKNVKGIYYKQGTPYTGDAISYYDSGKVKATGSFLGGKFHGDFISYYENGLLRSKMKFVNNKLQGKLEKYHGNGHLKLKENYVDVITSYSIHYTKLYELLQL